MSVSSDYFADHVRGPVTDQIVEHYESSHAGEQALARAIALSKEFEMTLLASPAFERAVGRYGADKNADRFAAHIIAGIGYDRFVIFAQNFPLLVPVLVSSILDYAYESGRSGRASHHEGWTLVYYVYKRAGVEAKQ